MRLRNPRSLGATPADGRPGHDWPGRSGSDQDSEQGGRPADGGAEDPGPERPDGHRRRGDRTADRTGPHGSGTGGRTRPDEPDDAGRTADSPRRAEDGHDRTGDPRSTDGGGPDRTRRADRTGPDRTRPQPDRSRPQPGGQGRRTDRTERWRPGDQTDPDGTREPDDTRARPRRTGDGTGSADDNRPGGSRTPRPDSTGNLRTYGPVVAHFHGRVEKVFGTAPRPAPTWRPLLLACGLLAAAFVLPYAVALTPLILLVVVLLLWLRHRNWLPGGPGRRGARPDRQADGLQTTTFRVRILADDDRTPFATLDCRLVQRAEAGPVPLASGDVVRGRGRRVGRAVVEVARVDIGESATTSLTSTSPKSPTPVFVLASMITLAAAALVWFRWDSVPPISWESLLYPLVSLLVPVLVIYVIVKKVILRR